MEYKQLRKMIKENNEAFTDRDDVKIMSEVEWIKDFDSYQATLANHIIDALKFEVEISINGSSKRVEDIHPDVAYIHSLNNDNQTTQITLEYGEDKLFVSLDGGEIPTISANGEKAKSYDILRDPDDVAEVYLELL